MKHCHFFTIFIIVLFFSGGIVSAQTLSVSPQKSTIAVSERTTVRVYANSIAQAINAVSGTLSYRGGATIISVDTQGSIIDFWTRQPSIVGATVSFEGIALNPGFRGNKGLLFSITLEGRKEGAVSLVFSNAALLANDGLGSNILSSVQGTTLTVRGGGAYSISESTANPLVKALPVITEYPYTISASEGMYIRGKGEPGAITKLVFKNTSLRSIGEQFITSLRRKRDALGDVYVKNNTNDGSFEFQSAPGLVAGAYNVTPFLVDATTNERPGLGVQLFISDSKVVRALIIFINILALLIPIVGLIVLAYFIPWYSFRRMRLIKRKLRLEEEKVTLSSHDISREDKEKEHHTQQVLEEKHSPTPE